MAEVIYGCRLLVVTVLDPETGLPPETNPVTAYIDTPQQFGVSPAVSRAKAGTTWWGQVVSCC